MKPADLDAILRMGVADALGMEHESADADIIAAALRVREERDVACADLLAADVQLWAALQIPPDGMVAATLRTSTMVERVVKERDELRAPQADQQRAFVVRLQVATAPIEPLRAEIAELRATLANERGEGEPPVEGWAYTDCAGWGMCWVCGGGPDGWIAVTRKPAGGWYIRLGATFLHRSREFAVSIQTAREAMRKAGGAS